MPKVFSVATLERFEEAAASIPLRQLERAFSGAGFRPSVDPGGPEGARRTQFRRYIAGIDQHDGPQRDRLGDVLGALIEEVAASKKAFLVTAAESDGFVFDNGVFRLAARISNSFAVKQIDSVAGVDDCGHRLRVLANDDPTEAIAGSKALIESVCRTALRLMREPAPRKTAELVDIAASAIDALASFPTFVDDQRERVTFERAFLQQLVAGVVMLATLQVTPRSARLAIGAAVAFAEFVAEASALIRS